jgi:hypothetical protein
MRSRNHVPHVRSSKTSSSADFSAGLIQDSSETRRIQRNPRLARGRPEDLTLHSAGPSHDTRLVIDIDQRVVVSEGESIGKKSNPDSDATGYSSSSDDYGETEWDRQQRLLVGAGGLQSSHSELLHSNWPGSVADALNSEERPGNHEIDHNLAGEGEHSLYTGSESSDSAPMEVKRRRPTISSVRDTQGASSSWGSSQNFGRKYLTQQINFNQQ